ncbi:hypothetical protein [Arthrobacter sp. PM3]|uniref:hypothetical protein n=1 Tax=Arthrobacter sp. PM3 TaxID=2017685 RepID=UPI000E10D1C2|nr:hypothetical protein [Arthrobacter sp. PM3]AXJ11246.1 hypothetical protein CFN17_17755 [Arthrobacter sp. PM3]
MHTEIPDALLVPGAAPIPIKDPPPAYADRDAPDQESADLTAIQTKESQQLERELLHRRKRRVALLAILFVAICLPAIVLALLLG